MTKKQQNGKEPEKEKLIAIGACLGVVVGAVVGHLADDTGLWISICIAIGAGLGASVNDKWLNKKKNADS